MKRRNIERKTEKEEKRITNRLGERDEKQIHERAKRKTENTDSEKNVEWTDRKRNTEKRKESFCSFQAQPLVAPLLCFFFFLKFHFFLLFVLIDEGH